MLSAHLETPCRAVVEPVELSLWLQLPPQHVVVEMRPTQLCQRFCSPEGAEEYCRAFRLAYFPGYKNKNGLPEEGKCKVNLSCETPCGLHEWTAAEGSLELTYARLGEPVELCIPMDEPTTLELAGQQICCRPSPEKGEVELRCNMRLVAVGARDDEGEIDVGLDEEEDEDDEEGRAQRYTLAVCTESRRVWVRFCVLGEPVTESVPYRAERVMPEACHLQGMPCDDWMEREFDRVKLWAHVAMPEHVAALEFCGMETSFTFTRGDGEQVELSPIACVEAGGLTYSCCIHRSTLTFHLPEDWNEVHMNGVLHYMLWEMGEYSEARKISLCAPGSVKLGEHTVQVLPLRLKNGCTRVRLSSEVPLAALETQFIENEQKVKLLSSCRYIFKMKDGSEQSAHTGSPNAEEVQSYIYEYDLCTEAAEVSLRLRLIRAPYPIRIPISRKMREMNTRATTNFMTIFCMACGRKGGLATGAGVAIP